MWALGEPRRLAEPALSALTAAENSIFASVACAWELEIKRNAGKLRIDGDLIREADAAGVTWLRIDLSHVVQAARLPLHHRNPFDRMLVAQAQLEGLTIVTSDPDIARYQVAILAAA